MPALSHLAQQIFLQSLADCSIPRAMDRVLALQTGPQGQLLLVPGQPPLNLEGLRHLCLVAAGKAAGPMLQAALERPPIPPACRLSGVLIAPTPLANLPAGVRYFAGGHPTPNQASFDGASAALDLVREIATAPPGEALCLFLISGGASAMMELPLDPSISLADAIAFHRELVHSGASIVEINTVRKHFSAVKGGRLAQAAGAARTLTLAVSDVPPAQLDALASGPTLPDTTTIAQCRDVLHRYDLLDRLPPRVRNYFSSPALRETPKPGDLVSPCITLLDSTELAHAAQARAAALGFYAEIDDTTDDWPLERAADHLLERLRSLRHQHPRCCLIAPGEVTIAVPQFHDTAPHLGGRNQHLALYLATQLRPKDAPLAILSAGSDGIDGNSAAAGAIIDTTTIANDADRASALRALAAFDSSSWLAARNAALVTGPTGQNLRDLRILLADAGS